MLYDFGVKKKKGEIETVDEYFKMIDDKGADKLLLDAIMEREKFERMEEGIDEHTKT